MSASPNDARPEMSVVIVNWNARRALVDCIGSLIEHPPPVPWEVVVVDNASTDGSVASVRDLFPWARVIANATNRGLPAANNQGMAAAQGETFLICNPDVLFAEGAVAAMLAVLERHPRAAFVVPRLRYADGSLATSAGDLPRLSEALLGRQIVRQRARHGIVAPGPSASGFWWDGWAHDEEREIGRGHEAAYLVRRGAVAEFGMQDEAFFLDWEGPDWTARARDAGWEVWLAPEAEVTHLGGASIRQAPTRWIVRSHRGMYRYFSRRMPAWERPALAVACAARAVVKLVAARAGVASYERGHGRG